MKRTLDWQTKQQVRYCIPMWLRDEQIRQSTARISGRIQPGERREDPVAVVGFGPSLQDTWEQIQNFKYVISCSGSHKFLIERGIIPTWHVEVDPRPHKVQLIGPPQKETTYLIASTCHKDVFDHLEGHTVLLWHVFDAGDEGRRLLPHGEWAITGGCDVGLRAITIAGFLGFRNLHIFGMDGCGRDTSHADAHPNAVKKYLPCEYDGVTYQTTPALLEAARSVEHELSAMPAINATFYGEGLIQHMARNFKRKDVKEPEKFANIVGCLKPELISAEYCQLNVQLHKENLAYGVGGGKHAQTVMKLAESLNTRSVLDYGCGKSYLAKAIPWPIWEYDPAIPGKEESPRPADLVVCTDVLEHIEPDKLNFVLDDLRRVTRTVGYFVIHTKAAQKTLPDGRNTHLIQKGKRWWQARLRKFFTVGKIIEKNSELHVVVVPMVVVKKHGKLSSPRKVA